MSYDNLSSISENVLKFYQQLTGEEQVIVRHRICLRINMAKPVYPPTTSLRGYNKNCLSAMFVNGSKRNEQS
jgi:hypothetical protein